MRIVFIPRAAKLLVAALVVVFAAIAVWSVIGTVPTKISGNSIILSADEQFYQLQAQEVGRVVTLHVDDGDQVEANAVLAEVSTPSLDLELELEKARLDDLKTRLEAAEQRSETEQAQRQALADDELQALHANQQAARQQVDAMTSNDAGYYDAVMQLNNVTARIAAVQTQLLESRANQDAALADLRQQTADQEQEVRELEKRVATAQQILAPVSGVVREVRTQVGQIINALDILITVSESSRDGYEAIAFFPIEIGGRIADNMSARIMPDTVDRDQYGAIPGQVTSISVGPVSSAHIDVLIGNEQIADVLTGGTAVYVARIALADDSQTPSGFAWTSGGGPPYAVTIGTPATVDVVVREEPPIALVIPAFRELLAD